MENRLTLRLSSYWDLLRKGNETPNFSSFNSSAINDVWQQCILFLVQPSDALGNHFLQFQTIGEKLRPLYSSDLIGKHINSAQRHFPGAAIVRRVEEVIGKPQALFDDGQFVNERGKVVKFRSCLVPFSSKDRISHIVVGLSWREF